MKRLALLAALALTGASHRSRDPFDGMVAGPPQECIQLTATDGLAILDDHTIIYRDGSRLWRTTPIGACPALAPLNILITESFGGQICRRDRFRVREPNVSIPSGFCQFGAFTPYTKVKR